jgi:hypothetical protein
MPLDINTSHSVVAKRYLDMDTIQVKVLPTLYVMP